MLLLTNAFWTTITAFIASYLFYLARFKNKFRVASLSFAFASYLLLTVNFFINSGIAGPTLYGFFLTFILLIIISPPRQRSLCVVLHLTIVPALFLTEAYFPSLVQYQYDSTQLQITDLSATYIPVILSLFVVANLVGSSYNHEKRLAERSAAQLARKNEELEFSNREKDRLFSIIGHDLRSPLSTIHSYLEMLGSMDLHDDERMQLNAELLGITHNTTNLLNNLLNWSARTGNGPLNLHPLKVEPHLEEVIDLMLPEARRKKINLKLDLKQKDLMVLAESEMLYLIVRNLVNNALKFTPENGTIRVSAYQNGDSVAISVKDNGIGIPTDKQKYVFGTRLKPSPGTQSESGIGLGLVLCKEFATTMGCDITFSSEENVGTEFIVTLNMPD